MSMTKGVLVLRFDVVVGGAAAGLAFCIAGSTGGLTFVGGLAVFWAANRVFLCFAPVEEEEGADEELVEAIFESDEEATGEDAALMWSSHLLSKNFLKAGFLRLNSIEALA